VLLLGFEQFEPGGKPFLSRSDALLCHCFVSCQFDLDVLQVSVLLGLDHIREPESRHQLGIEESGDLGDLLSLQRERAADGSYRLQDEFRFLIARA
jgi:hypothetical protein